MARVEVAPAAIQDLDRLISVHTLPVDTKQRVKRLLKSLEQFPRLGPELSGRWRQFRFILGPWRWMIIVYVFLEDEDHVAVVTMQDGRSSTSATAHR